MVFMDKKKKEYKSKGKISISKHSLAKAVPNYQVTYEKKPKIQLKHCIKPKVPSFSLKNP